MIQNSLKVRVGNVIKYNMYNAIILHKAFQIRGSNVKTNPLRNLIMRLWIIFTHEKFFNGIEDAFYIF